MADEMKESLHWTTEWKIEKFKDDGSGLAERLKNGTATEEEIKKAKYETVIFPKNLAVTTGLMNICKLVSGTGGTQWGTGAYIGVGTSTTAAAIGQTDLVAPSARVAMDSGWPKDTGGHAVGADDGTIQFKSTFDGSTANVAWEEYGVFTASTGGVMLNRLVASKGTKVSGEIWTLQVTITFS